MAITDKALKRRLAQSAADARYTLFDRALLDLVYGLAAYSDPVDVERYTRGLNGLIDLFSDVNQRLQDAESK